MTIVARKDSTICHTGVVMFHRRKTQGDTMTVRGDFATCPEFFVTDIVTEPAGGGCVRVFNYCRRDGMLTPVYTVVVPADYLMMCSRVIDEAARDVFNKQTMAGAIHPN